MTAKWPCRLRPLALIVAETLARPRGWPVAGGAADHVNGAIDPAVIWTASGKAWWPGGPEVPSFLAPDRGRIGIDNVRPPPEGTLSCLPPVPFRHDP